METSLKVASTHSSNPVYPDVPPLKPPLNQIYMNTQIPQTIGNLALDFDQTEMCCCCRIHWQFLIHHQKVTKLKHFKECIKTHQIPLNKVMSTLQKLHQIIHHSKNSILVNHQIPYMKNKSIQEYTENDKVKELPFINESESTCQILKHTVQGILCLDEKDDDFQKDIISFKYTDILKTHDINSKFMKEICQDDDLNLAKALSESLESNQTSKSGGKVKKNKEKSNMGTTRIQPAQIAHSIVKDKAYILFGNLEIDQSQSPNTPLKKLDNKMNVTPRYSKSRILGPKNSNKCRFNYDDHETSDHDFDKFLSIALFSEKETHESDQKENDLMSPNTKINKNRLWSLASQSNGVLPFSSLYNESFKNRVDKKVRFFLMV